MMRFKAIKRVLIVLFVSLLPVMSAACGMPGKTGSGSVPSGAGMESFSSADEQESGAQQHGSQSGDKLPGMSAAEGGNASASASNTGASAGSAQSAVPVAPSDNWKRPRTVNNTNPLYDFIGVPWDNIPDDIKQYASVRVDGKKIGTTAFSAYEEEKIPIVLQGENWISHTGEPIIPLDKLEELLKKHKNIIGVSFVEQSCTHPRINQTQIKRIIDTINMCAKYKCLFIWEDMGYPDRDNIFAVTGTETELFNTIKKNKDCIVLVNKMNGWGQYFMNQAIISGYWTSGLCAAWGLNSEDFWWAENGYGPLYKDSDGRQAHCLNDLGGYDEANATKARYCIPDALIGQMVGLAMIQGASFFSFENAERVLTYDSKMVPLFTQVIYPLHKLGVQDKLIPSRRQVLSRTKAAYYLDDIHAPAVNFPSDELFRGLYGSDQHNAEWVTSKRVSPEFIPSTGRYYNLPVIPTLGKAEGAAAHKTLLDSKSLPADKAAYFNKLYAQNGTGTAAAMYIDDLAFITHPYENTNTDASFSAFSLGSAKLSGTLKPHSYIYAKAEKSRLKLHINNFTVDTQSSVWNNKSFSTHGFLREYVKENSAIVTSMKRVTILSVEGFSKDSKITVSGGSAKKEYKNGAWHFTVTHNGPVDIVMG